MSSTSRTYATRRRSFGSVARRRGSTSRVCSGSTITQAAPPPSSLSSPFFFCSCAFLFDRFSSLRAVFFSSYSSASSSSAHSQMMSAVPPLESELDASSAVVPFAALVFGPFCRSHSCFRSSRAFLFARLSSLRSDFFFSYSLLKYS